MSKHTVIDVIEIKGEFKTQHKPGLVVVLDSAPVELPQLGTIVDVRTPSGQATSLRVDEVKRHGATISLYFTGKAPADIPKGSVITVV